MSYVDKLVLHIQSGNGGDGRISFRKEKYVPKGGPDGGDGGDGGSIVIKTSKKISTFLDLSNKKKYKANHGENGKGKKQKGKNGQDCTLIVPCGTSIYNNETNELIIDLIKENETFCIAKGGKGGKGNPHFSTSRIQAPQKATTGKPGIELTILLELKVIANIGTIGFPNAGKSTLLKTLTQANPKIANYPFTTLHPNLGILRFYDQEIVIADIPGIILGASKGIGLGNTFLRHISRTEALLFIIEPNLEDLDKTIDSYNILVNELNEYSKDILKNKKTIIALSKCDQIDESEISSISNIFKEQDIEILPISCFSLTGIDKLKQRILKHAKKTPYH